MRLSISKIKAFKACKKLYELKYIERLEPRKKPEALESGSNYHKLLEELNNGVDIRSSHNYDYSKEMAMALAYEKYIFPKFHVVEAEKWLEYSLVTGDKLVGIVPLGADGRAHPVSQIAGHGVRTVQYPRDRGARHACTLRNF